MMIAAKESELNRTENTEGGKEFRHSPGFRIAMGVLGLLVVVAALGWLTLSLDPALPAQSGAVYPYTSTYDLQAPDGQSLMIGNTAFLVLTAGDEAHMKIGDSRETLAVGETKTITEKRAVVKTLGVTVFDTNYRIDATYRGLVDNKADFSVTVRTSSQIPQFLIDRMLPGEMKVRPV